MKRSLRWLFGIVVVLLVFMALSLGAETLLASLPGGGGSSSAAPSSPVSSAPAGGAASAGSPDAPAGSQSTAGQPGGGPDQPDEPSSGSAGGAGSQPAEGSAAAADAQAQLDDWRMILVSPVSPMPDGYTVETKACNSDTTNNKLQTEAADAFLQMKDAAAADGVTLHLQSGYRSVEYQSNLFNKQIQKWKDAGMNEADATEKAKTVVTPPGCSEHNCGLAADINSPEYWSLDEPFKNTNAYAWLCAHAEDYGFILRYPKDKEDITGIIYEPWHWRYVGVENARRINASGLCLEEYVEQLRQAAAG